jgi:predicted O-linked N-acetylglucosamine transferase (SPINDLY family)
MTESSPDIFTPSQLKAFEAILAAHLDSPQDIALRRRMLAFRCQTAELLAALPVAQIPSLLQGSFAPVFRNLLSTVFSAYESPAELPPQFTGLLDGCRVEALSSDPRSFLSCMLLLQSHRVTIPNLTREVPDWLLDDYLAWALQAPPVFLHAGEADDYAAHILSWLRELSKDLFSASPHAHTLRAARHFAAKANFIPIYFASTNTRELATLRASIMEHVLRSQGSIIDAGLPVRGEPRSKIRVGFLNAHFGQQTETHITLPNLRLDRDKFEVRLYALFANPGPVEDYCRSLSDSFTVLPQDTGAQVRALRAANLDVVVIGTNVTAVTNHVALLALHRLAPVQLVNYCSPVSTGMRNVDGYISGTLNAAVGLQDHFSERLYYCDGSPGCFDYSVEPPAALNPVSRVDFGFPEDAVVLVNAAACFKILPEMQDTWAKILAAVPNARLILLPFNPNWSKTFPVKQFRFSLSCALLRRGVSPDRVIFAPPLPSRADVKMLESLGDVYLDTFPFSGSISVVDALQVGLPTVVWEAQSHRSRMASALLRDLDIPELVAEDEQAYVARTVALATDPGFRDRMRAKILQRMSTSPRFLDPVAYGRQLGDLLEKLVRERGNCSQAVERTPLPSGEVSQAGLP